MFENILVAILCIAAAAVGIWCCWYEAGGNWEKDKTGKKKIMKEKKTKITIEMVMKLRSHSGALTEAMVKRYLSTETIKKKCYKVPSRIVEKYFEGMDPNQVDAIVEQALEAWFSKEAANVRTEEP